MHLFGLVLNFVQITLWLILAVVYGTMGAITTQLARGRGIDKDAAIFLGIAWPVGIGVAFGFGAAKNAAMDEQARETARIKHQESLRQLSVIQQNQDLLDQTHRTKMAELLARENIALDRVRDTRSVEGPRIQGEVQEKPDLKKEDY